MSTEHRTLEEHFLSQIDSKDLLPTAPPPIRPAVYIDPRTGPLCQRQFDQTTANMEAAERSANNAADRLKDAQERKEVLVLGRKKITDHFAKKAPRVMTLDVRSQLDKIDRETKVLDGFIAEASDKVDRERRIADGYRRILKEFLSTRPMPGLPTNEEVIKEWRAEESLNDVIDNRPQIMGAYRSGPLT